jgi:hypothetical protein
MFPTILALSNDVTDVILNSALYTDSCLFIVPRSHKIPRTEEQRFLSLGQVPENPLDMPGAIQLVLQR